MDASPKSSQANDKCSIYHGKVTIADPGKQQEASPELHAPDYPSWLEESEDPVDWAQVEPVQGAEPADECNYVHINHVFMDGPSSEPRRAHTWKGRGHCSACNVPVSFFPCFGGQV